VTEAGSANRVDRERIPTVRPPAGAGPVRVIDATAVVPPAAEPGAIRKAERRAGVTRSVVRTTVPP